MKLIKNKIRIANMPNILSFSRIIIAIVMFVVIPLGFLKTSFVLFLIATATDWFDGWCARKFNQVSQLGRNLDTFADKVIVCGSFIYLLAFPELLKITFPFTGSLNWGLAYWMVVLIVLRELLITMLRSLVEGSGGDFSAKWVGKWKMALQCVAIPACFLYLILLKNNIDSGLFLLLVRIVLVGSLWITILLTVWSAIVYVRAASLFLGKSDE